MALIVGIDEAGRGPVIGPLVIAGVMIHEKDEPKLIKLGVKDSKQLTEKRRNELFQEIKDLGVEYEILIIHPKEIDETLRSPSSNLNWLEADKSVEIIKKLKPDGVILDCPSTVPEKYKQYVEQKLKDKTNVIAEHKADDNYPVVSAASILAKVTRDAEIEAMKKKYGDCGSGYPSDPKTQEFLKKNFKKYPEIFRQTWESYKNIIRKKEQKGLGDF
jgi:ribonuclease HII